uniref:Uncharacterized protein n=1 Tax=Romanomermis culicivorax TaxID=13658 RepID=A0A915IN92_ROMCU
MAAAREFQHDRKPRRGLESSSSSPVPQHWTEKDIANRIDNYRTFRKQFFVNSNNIMAVIRYFASMKENNGKVDAKTVALCTSILGRDNWRPFTPQKAERLIACYLLLLEKNHQIENTKSEYWQPAALDSQ